MSPAARAQLNILDLVPVVDGGSAADAIASTVDVAKHAEKWGYQRYWMAEHHNMRGVASSSTAVLIGHVADHTETIRVGAGGIMLPNHAPYVVAEQFGTLATMHPGRIDLGLGRAPGTDPFTTRALRRNEAAAMNFAGEVEELIGYLGDPDPDAKVRAIPGEGTHVPIWILGSSHGGAQVAAALGLPYSFASHFAPAALMSALEVYRSRFTPSTEPGGLDAPRTMAGVNVMVADTTEEAERLFTSVLQRFHGIVTGRRTALPEPSGRHRLAHGAVVAGRAPGRLRHDPCLPGRHTRRGARRSHRLRRGDRRRRGHRHVWRPRPRGPAPLVRAARRRVALTCPDE